MRIGVISDTHGLLRPEVFDVLRGVDRIVHAGDVGDPDILIALAAIAPVSAVWGNTDGWDLRNRIPETVTLNVEGVEIVVVHGHQHGSPSIDRLAAEYPRARMIVYGHTHQPAIDRVGEILCVNPGSAGPARFSLPITVAIATIDGGNVSAEHVELLERSSR
jgi:uncharacterized protein